MSAMRDAAKRPVRPEVLEAVKKLPITSECWSIAEVTELIGNEMLKETRAQDYLKRIKHLLECHWCQSLMPELRDLFQVKK